MSGSAINLLGVWSSHPRFFLSSITDPFLLSDDLTTQIFDAGMDLLCCSTLSAFLPPERAGTQGLWGQSGLWQPSWELPPPEDVRPHVTHGAQVQKPEFMPGSDAV